MSPPQEITRRRRLVVLGICCASMFLVGVDTTAVNVALPSIGHDLHVPVSGLQWTVDAYLLVLASLLMFSGANADRFGRRRVFQAGLVVFTLSSLLCSLAPSLGWLLAFRVLQAVGGSMLNPVALSIIVSTFPDAAERPRAIGVFQAMLGLSMACGPILGGLMLGAAGWRGIFWINVPVGLVALELTGRLVPESRAPRPRRPDPVGQVLVIVMLGSLTYGIIEGPGYGWYSAKIFGCFSLAMAALAVLLAYEPRRRDPMIELRFFRSVPFSGASVAAICAFAAQSGFLFLSTLYLQDVRDFSPLDAGLHVVPMAAAMAFCAPLAGRIVARGRTRAAMLIAGAALTLSCAALSRVTAVLPTWELIGAYAVFGMGIGMVNAPITNAAVSGMPREQAGLAGGIMSASRQVGQALGVAIAGSVLAARMRGSVHSGFVAASHPAWWILAGFAYAVLLVGTFATSQWAKATAARVAARMEVAARPAPVSTPTPVATSSGPEELAGQVWRRMGVVAAEDAELYGDPRRGSHWPIRRLPAEDLTALDQILGRLLDEA